MSHAVHHLRSSGEAEHLSSHRRNHQAAQHPQLPGMGIRADGHDAAAAYAGNEIR